MKDSGKSIIDSLNEFIDQQTIDMVKYNQKSSSWWKGQKAILINKEENLSGGVIEKGATVCILYRMQCLKFGEVIHTGAFAIRDLTTKVCVMGVDSEDLLLIGEKIELEE